MTGSPAESGAKTEVIDLLDPNNHCTSTDFPIPLSEATGGLLGTDLPMICGGDIGGDKPGDQCYILKDKNFMPVVKLNEPTQEFGFGSVVHDNSLIIISGYTNTSKSKQFLAVSPEEVKELPDTIFEANCNIFKS